MHKTISILCVALALLIGTALYADAIGHDGSHGGGLGHGSVHGPWTRSAAGYTVL
jgi:hypothetical protein